MSRDVRAKAEILSILRRGGISQAIISDIDRKLPEVADVDTIGAVLQSYGITRDLLISDLGGSP